MNSSECFALKPVSEVLATAPTAPIQLPQFTRSTMDGYALRAADRVLAGRRYGGLNAESVSGYAHEEYTHMGMAAAVATGVADCGLGVRSAADALGLDFVTVGWERYDLVIPAAHLNHPGIGHLLDVLHSTDVVHALDAQPGYDTHETGKVQRDLSHNTDTA